MPGFLQEMQIEVRDQVRREMDANLAEVKVALNETVEMSSQRNKQLEVAVAAAEQAFRERDEARGLLAEANRRLAEYTAKVEDLETSVGEAIDSASGFAVLSDQLTEQRTLTERYRKALKEAEDRLRAIEKLDKSNKAKLQEAEASASSKAEYLRQQLRIQQAEASEARQRHETEASGLRAKLRASRERERAALALADGSGTAKDRLARDKAAFQDTVALQEVTPIFPSRCMLPGRW
jgi:hypothetical protein